MTEREMLELAARAMGRRFDGLHLISTEGIIITPSWNPVHKDGDALSLATELCIDIEWRADGCVSAYQHAHSNGHCFTVFEPIGSVGVRMAIARVAAEIGRRMANEKTEGEMSDYTKGRLFINSDLYVVVNGKYILPGWHKVSINTEICAPSIEAIENARRLVACWNACAGIPTEELERRANKQTEDG